VTNNQNQGFGMSAGGSGFLQILGIIYLIKIIRRRRERRRQPAPAIGNDRGSDGSSGDRRG
jgi:hypothetical protein